MTLKIAVAVKVVPKTEEVELDEESMTIDRENVDSQINPADKNGVEMALEFKDSKEITDEVEVIAISMGPPFVQEQLQDIIAMGVDDAVLLSDPTFAGSDTYPTSHIIAKSIEKLGNIDLILCGEESSDSSTGQVPPGIAEWLDANQVTYVNDARIENGEIRASRTVRGGEETVRVPLPAVISVEYGINEPRFPDFKRKRWAENEWELTVWDKRDLNLSEDAVGLEGSYTEVVELESIEGPKRRKKWIEGSVENKVNEITEILEEKKR